MERGGRTLSDRLFGLTRGTRLISFLPPYICVLSIATAPNHLGGITSLAALGIISSDKDLVEAALSEIKDLPPHQIKALDLDGDVDYIVSIEQFSRVSSLTLQVTLLKEHI